MENSKQITLSIPEMAMVVGTRAFLGTGVGLLLASRLSHGQRKAIGWTLAGVGAISTIPLAFEVFGKRRALGNKH
jgi:hypothetical protein